MKIQNKEYRTIWYEENVVKIIDQTKLPHQFIIKDLKTVKDAINAIKVMEVRGAPLIGSTAAYGMALAVQENNDPNFIKKSSEELIESRPTAINLKWAVDRMMKKLSGINSDQILDIALKEAKEICNNNIAIFKDIVTAETPLIGIEPSAILGFRDEYLRLADDKASAKKIAKNSFTFEEFLSQELEKGNIDTSLFTSEEKDIKIHGHCHQKALSGTHATFSILNIPSNYKVSILNTGCCGMAGSFGYEKEHYKVSMQVGEDTLFPKVRNCTSDTEIAAAGTSCRHQIFDGTKRLAKHPITILKEALS